MSPWGREEMRTCTREGGRVGRIRGPREPSLGGGACGRAVPGDDPIWGLEGRGGRQGEASRLSRRGGEGEAGGRWPSREPGWSWKSGRGRCQGPGGGAGPRIPGGRHGEGASSASKHFSVRFSGKMGGRGVCCGNEGAGGGGKGGSPYPVPLREGGGAPQSGRAQGNQALGAAGGPHFLRGRREGRGVGRWEAVGGAEPRGATRGCPWSQRLLGGGTRTWVCRCPHRLRGCVCGCACVVCECVTRVCGVHVRHVCMGFAFLFLGSSGPSSDNGVSQGLEAWSLALKYFEN